GVAAALLIACSSTTPSPQPSTAATAEPSLSTTPAVSAAPLRAVPAQAVLKRKWFTLPDRLFGGPGGIYAQFAADPTSLSPVARLRPSAREAPFLASTGPNFMAATIDLAGLEPRVYAVDVVEHLGAGIEAVVATTEIFVSQPEYVVWTLDFEGDAASDETMGKAAAIADALSL